jgi:hypothetical protein
MTKPAVPALPPKDGISLRLRIALDSMVEQGLELDAAARKAKMTTRAVRLALSRPHVLRYLRRARADFISAIRATNPRRLRELRDQETNPAAAVRAAIALEQLDGGDQTPPPGGRLPGITIIIERNPAGPRVIGPPMIDAKPNPPAPEHDADEAEDQP